MKLKTVVVDDEPIARQGLKSFIEKIDFLTLIDEANNVSGLIEILRHSAIDLIFLDIEMSGLSGIDFVKTYSEKLPLIIFITAYHEYAVESYDLHAVDYLLKPVSFERFVDASNRALDIQLLNASRNETYESFYVKHAGRFIKINPDEVEYVSAMQNYVHIHFVGDKKLTIRSTLKEFQDHLDPNVFVKIHKSYIINKAFVASLTTTDVTLKSTIQIPIGRKYKSDIRQSLLS